MLSFSDLSSIINNKIDLDIQSDNFVSSLEPLLDQFCKVNSECFNLSKETNGFKFSDRTDFLMSLFKIIKISNRYKDYIEFENIFYDVYSSSTFTSDDYEEKTSKFKYQIKQKLE